MTSKPTQLNAVIGFPLAHSKSPLLHNALYKKLGINAVMRPFNSPDIRQLINTIKSKNIGLTAVTMPFKQTVMRYLDFVDKSAKVLGAVNAIINRQGKLQGYNTDINGIAAALKNVTLKNRTILLIGGGGAARAAAYYIRSRGGEIFYLNRTKSKARKLQAKFGGTVINYKGLVKPKIEVFINATPIGMYPKVNRSPLPEYQFSKNQTVFDLVYNPVQTKLLKDAKAAGARTISGRQMFIAQALKQIELYSGKKAQTVKLRQFAQKILSL